MIDASHDNSGKDHDPPAAGGRPRSRDQVAAGNGAIVGVMLESFLVAGRQDLTRQPLVYGQSITDACMDWETTVLALDRLAAAARSRRDAG